MCFAIPYRVTKIDGNNATIEDGRIITLGAELTVQPGMYVEIAGNIAVSAMSQKTGDSIRTYIKEIASTI